VISGFSKAVQKLLFLISQLFLRVANRLHGHQHLFISFYLMIFVDFCSTDYVVQIAVSTTQYQ